MKLKNVNLTDELEEVKAMEKLISNSIIEIKEKTLNNEGKHGEEGYTSQL